MKKHLAAIQYTIIAACLVASVVSILWICHDMRADQQEAFRVIESGQAETLEEAETCGPDNMTAVCAVTTMSQLKARPPEIDSRQMKLAWDMCYKEYASYTCSQVDPRDGMPFYLKEFYNSPEVRHARTKAEYLALLEETHEDNEGKNRLIAKQAHLLSTTQ